MDAHTLVYAIVKILIMVGFVFNIAALLTWSDRRQSSMIQDRIGPNRAVLKIGKFELRVAGLLHTAADGVKFFFKEDFVPPNANKVLFSLAPILAMMPVLSLIAVITSAIPSARPTSSVTRTAPGSGRRSLASASAAQTQSPGVRGRPDGLAARHRPPLRLRPRGAGDRRRGDRRLVERQQVLAHGRPPRGEARWSATKWRWGSPSSAP